MTLFLTLWMLALDSPTLGTPVSTRSHIIARQVPPADPLRLLVKRRPDLYNLPLSPGPLCVDLDMWQGRYCESSYALELLAEGRDTLESAFEFDVGQWWDECLSEELPSDSSIDSTTPAETTIYHVAGYCPDHTICVPWSPRENAPTWELTAERLQNAFERRQLWRERQQRRLPSPVREPSPVGTVVDWDQPAPRRHSQRSEDDESSDTASSDDVNPDAEVESTNQEESLTTDDEHNELRAQADDSYSEGASPADDPTEDYRDDHTDDFNNGFAIGHPDEPVDVPVTEPWESTSDTTIPEEEREEKHHIRCIPYADWYDIAERYLRDRRHHQGGDSVAISSHRPDPIPRYEPVVAHNMPTSVYGHGSGYAARVDIPRAIPAIESHARR